MSGPIRIRRNVLVGIAVLSALAACDRADDMSVRSSELAILDMAAEQAASPAPLQVAQRLIRTASATIEVANVDAAVTSARALSVRLNGLVARSEVHRDRGGTPSAELTLRIPADSLDAFMTQVESLGTVRSISTSSMDVSREYFDAETRLAVMEETVQRLRQLAARADDVEGLVAVERELSRATAELESLKGQIRYFDQRVAETDVQLRLLEAQSVFRTSAFRPVGTAVRSALNVFAESVAMLVYLIVFLIPWLFLAVILTPLLRRAVRARRARRERATGT
jgi:hypothetical protein